jgi:two-component system, sensor histidine kinase and response regulator
LPRNPSSSRTWKRNTVALPEIIINVDDHEPARYAKGKLLSHAGFVVHDAGNGQDALELIEQHHPDLVLLDVHLPDMTGIEVCRRVKSTPVGASVIILQISASAIGAPQAAAALNSGADAYLTEPIEPDVLIATVKALLRLRKAERELSAANERLKQLNKELYRSNEDLQQFAFAASHDLQEPLRTVTSFVTLLERTAIAKLNEDEQEYLRFIADGSRRMRMLIDDLLRYSQVGQKPASIQRVDLNQVLTMVLENLREGISESEAEIEYDPLPLVFGDEAQLGQVFQNLISNAIKYGRPGTRPVIHVSTGSGSEHWLIAVADNGVGVESEYRQLIFAPFKRLHGREISGTGMGLAICRRVIEAHGGRIWVEPGSEHGSRFCFTLPRNGENGQAPD